MLSILYTLNEYLLFISNTGHAFLTRKFSCFQSSLAPAVHTISLLRPALLQLFRPFISDKPTFPCLATAAVLSDVAI